MDDSADGVRPRLATTWAWRGRTRVASSMEVEIGERDPLAPKTHHGPRAHAAGLTLASSYR